MTNVQTSISAGFLTIRIDLTQKNGKSKSGNSTKIASTGGNINLEGEFKHVKLGLNCYTHKGHKFSAKKNKYKRIHEAEVLQKYENGELRVIEQAELLAEQQAETDGLPF